MKLTVFFGLIISQLTFAQGTMTIPDLPEMDQEKFSMFQAIPARIDHNKLINDVKDPFKSTDIAVIDGDETGGQLEAHFAMPIRGIKPFEKAQLIMNIPDIKDAESVEGIEIYYDEHLLGSCDKVERGSVLKVDIDLNPELKYGRTFSLTIKAKGSDGIYVYRWRSGWGVMLALYQ